jgi:hypothetical protein
MTHTELNRLYGAHSAREDQRSRRGFADYQYVRTVSGRIALAHVDRKER